MGRTMQDETNYDKFLPYIVYAFVGIAFALVGLVLWDFTHGG